MQFENRDTSHLIVETLLDSESRMITDKLSTVRSLSKLRRLIEIATEIENASSNLREGKLLSALLGAYIRFGSVVTWFSKSPRILLVYDHHRFASSTQYTCLLYALKTSDWKHEKWTGEVEELNRQIGSFFVGCVLLFFSYWGLSCWTWKRLKFCIRRQRQVNILTSAVQPSNYIFSHYIHITVCILPSYCIAILRAW